MSVPDHNTSFYDGPPYQSQVSPDRRTHVNTTLDANDIVACISTHLSLFSGKMEHRLHHLSDRLDAIDDTIQLLQSTHTSTRARTPTSNCSTDNDSSNDPSTPPCPPVFPVPTAPVLQSPAPVLQPPFPLGYGIPVMPVPPRAVPPPIPLHMRNQQIPPSTIPPPIPLHPMNQPVPPCGHNNWGFATGNASFKLEKFADWLHLIKLQGDDILSVRSFYSSIQVAVNIAGREHLTILPSFHSLSRKDTFAHYLLPPPNTPFYPHSYNLYESTGQKMAAHFISNDCITQEKSPRARQILQRHLLITDGWLLLQYILFGLCPSLGGSSSEDLHDQISSLHWSQNNDLSSFYTTVITLEVKLSLSQTRYPPNRLVRKFLDQLATSTAIVPYIAHFRMELAQFTQAHGDAYPHPTITVQSLYQFLLDSKAPCYNTPALLSTPPTLTTPISSDSSSSSNMQNMILATIRKRSLSIEKCPCCGLRGHSADRCGFRGSSFQPIELQKIITQYNIMNSSEPTTAPPDKWRSMPPSHTPSLNAMIETSSQITPSTVTDPSISLPQPSQLSTPSSEPSMLLSSHLLDPLASLSDQDIVPLIPDVDDPNGAGLYTL